MKLAVVCANGKAGLRIVEEAVSRGLDVTAVVRGENRSAARAVIRKDLFDLTAADLTGFDAVVDAFGRVDAGDAAPGTAGRSRTCATSSAGRPRACWWSAAPAACTSTRSTRPASRTARISPTPSSRLRPPWPRLLRSCASARTCAGPTSAPPRTSSLGGARTGSYTLGGEELILNAKGESVISYADYAIAMVDEAVSGNHIQQRISAVSA